MQHRILFSYPAFTIVVTVALAFAGCTTRTPAPVQDRSSPLSTRGQPATGALPPSTATTPTRGNTPGSQLYVVQRGDTLYRIALNNHIDINALRAWNDIAPGQTLRDGQVLRLTPPSSTTGTNFSSPTTPNTNGTASTTAAPNGGAIQGQPLSAPSLTPLPLDAQPGAASGTDAAVVPSKREPYALRVPFSESALLAMKQQAAGAKSDPASAAPALPRDQEASATTDNTATTSLAVNSVPSNVKPGISAERDGITWTWPTTGKVTSDFNEKAPMKGIEITTNTATPIVAAARGKVIYVGKEPRGYGQMVVISHTNQTVSIYFHTDKVLVREQQQVTLGQKIAEVGNGNKMHFEIRRQSRPFDPTSVLPR